MDPWGESAWTARDLLKRKPELAPPRDPRKRRPASTTAELAVWRIVVCGLLIQMLLMAIGYGMVLFWRMSH